MEPVHISAAVERALPARPIQAASTNLPQTSKLPSPQSSEPPAVCPECQGLRFVVRDLAVGHPDFGRSLPCSLCGGEVQQVALKRMSRLSDAMLKITFDPPSTIETEYNRAALAAMRAQVARPQWFVTLLGPNGRGKSHLLAALVNASIAAGHSAVYLTTAELLDELRATFAPKSKLEFSKVFDAALNAKVLVLDEFNRFNPTEWALEKFLQLIEYRYRKGDELLTAFASNAGFEDFEPYVASRMQDRRCLVFTIDGPDMRALM